MIPLAVALYKISLSISLRSLPAPALVYDAYIRRDITYKALLERTEKALRIYDSLSDKQKRAIVSLWINSLNSPHDKMSTKYPIVQDQLRPTNEMSQSDVSKIDLLLLRDNLRPVFLHGYSALNDVYNANFDAKGRFIINTFTVEEHLRDIKTRLLTGPSDNFNRFSFELECRPTYLRVKGWANTSRNIMELSRIRAAKSNTDGDDGGEQLCGRG